jgi:lycopene cyclase domain-containing protein
MHAYYLASLLVANGCWLIVDRRFCLAFFYDWRRTLYTIIPATLLFVLWDVCGIGFHIFLAGHSRYSLGIMLGKNFPLEEPVFLFLLSYTSLIVWRGLQRHAELRTTR